MLASGREAAQEVRRDLEAVRRERCRLLRREKKDEVCRLPPREAKAMLSSPSFRSSSTASRSNTVSSITLATHNIPNVTTSNPMK